MRKNLLFATLIIIFGFIGCTKAPISPEVASVPTVQSPNQTALNEQGAVPIDLLIGKWNGSYFQVRRTLDRNYYWAELQIEEGYVVYREESVNRGRSENRFVAAYEIRGNDLIIFIPKIHPMTKSEKTIIMTYDAKDGKLHGHRGDESGNVEGWRWIFERNQ